MLLDIGAGDRPFNDGREWTHHDARPLDDIEIVCAAEDLHKHVPEGSCEEILARHILEHFSHLETQNVLAGWLRLLKPGGVLKVEVPNLGWQVRQYAALLETGQGSHTEAELVELMFGGQEYPGNAHLTGFTEETLRRHLTLAGFKGAGTMDIGMVIIASGER